MKLVACSDLHLDAVTHGIRRFDEVANALMQTVDFAISQRADAWACLGDVCDPDSGPVVFRCVEVLQRAVLKLWSNNIPSVLIAGNHDVVESSEGTTTLSPLRALSGYHDGIYVVERPRTFKVRGKFDVACFPFTAAALPYGPKEHAESIPEGALVLSHLNLEGITPGSEVADMARGRDVFLPIDEVMARKPAAVLNGHIHKAQVYKGVRVVGAPARFTFGEESHVPTFAVVDF